MLLVELCNRELPYAHLFLTPLQVAIAVADRKLSPSLERATYPAALVTLIEACLQQAADKRPSFIEIVAQLRHAIVAVQRMEAAQEAAKQGSLLGRVSGMLQGVTAQAAAGLRGEGAAVPSRNVGATHGQPHVEQLRPQAPARGAPHAFSFVPAKPVQPPAAAQHLPQSVSSASSMLQGWMGRAVRRPADG